MPHEQGLTSDEQDLRSVVEATFGPGAFDLLATDDEPGPYTDPGEFTSDDDLPQQGTNTTGTSSCEETKFSDPSLDVANPSAEKKVMMFQLAGSLFSVPVNCVLEIQRELPATPIPHVRPWIVGVTNLRGSIISVIDVGVRLGLTGESPTSPRHMIVVRLSAKKALTILLVDQVIGIRTLAGSTRTSNCHVEDDATRFVLEWRESDTQPVAVLDVEAIASLE